MADSSTNVIDGIGPVLFQRSARARHLNISVRPPEGVRVAVPAGVSFRRAEEFVHAKTGWINKQLERVKRYENDRQTSQSNFRAMDKATAGMTLTGRLKQLAEKHGFSYNRVTLRNQKTRWGSCSHKNNISLNMKLVMLPEELMDYVILHELVHTTRKDHSPRFWAEMDRYLGRGRGKALAARLRAYAGSLL